MQESTIKEAIWKENDKEIKTLVTSRPKVADERGDTRKTRNYLTQINIDDARVKIQIQEQNDSQSKGKQVI